MPSASDDHVVGLSFGGNLGDPARQIADAIAAIEARNLARVTHVSSLWRTPPWGKTDQPAFLNACALVETQLPPASLLSALKDIERDIGRKIGERWGPRVIDIDILFYDDISLETAALTLPHRHLFGRAFVLAPLAEIVGERLVAGRRIADALADVDRQGLERLSRLAFERKPP